MTELMPTMPCTGCRLSFPGCANKWIAKHDVCCDICEHVREPQTTARGSRRINRIDRNH